MQQHSPGTVLKANIKAQTYLFLVLAVEEEKSTVHACIRGPVTGVFDYTNFRALPVMAMHSPFSYEAFELAAAEVLGSIAVEPADLEGYYLYLKSTDFPRYVSETGKDAAEIVATAQSAYKRGIAMEDQGDTEGAIQAYTEAIETFPLFYEAIDNRALLFLRSMQFQAAIDDAQQSLGVQPQNILALQILAQAAIALKQTDQAMAAYQRCLRIDPTHVEAQEYVAAHVTELPGS